MVLKILIEVVGNTGFFFIVSKYQVNNGKYINTSDVLGIDIVIPEIVIQAFKRCLIFSL